MFERYQLIKERYQEIGSALSQPNAADDQDTYRKLVMEYAKLQPQVDTWNEYNTLLSEEYQVIEMLNDPDVSEMAKEELVQIESKKKVLNEKLLALSMPSESDNEKNIIMEIRGGAGGEEAGLFGATLLRMYMRYAERNHYSCELLSVNETELGGIKEAVFSIMGNNSYRNMKHESGVHRVQRIPATESGGRIHTSTCTVAVLPEAEEAEIQILPNDIRIDYYRASGAGGQHVNRTDSAVRITHLLTGIVVTCQNEKSQIKNREQAMRVLRTRVYEKYQSEKEQEYADNRKLQVGTGDRSERIRTYNFPQGRVTDHRINLSLYRINDIIDGDLDELIIALLLDEQTRKAKEQERS